MCVRLYHWNEWDVYRFFNSDNDLYPNLPPPPNPRGLQAFMIACVHETIEQMNAENDPKGGKGGGRPPRRSV